MYLFIALTAGQKWIRRADYTLKEQDRVLRGQKQQIYTLSHVGYSGHSNLLLSIHRIFKTLSTNII